MSLRCGLFDSTEIVQTVDGYPQGNKAETADFFAHALAGLSGNGIPSSPADAFKVTANGSMVVSVAPGYCYINGYHAWDDETATITISSSSSSRSVYISLRLNLINGEITLISDTEFTRAQSIYDLALARIDIPANAVAITSDMVTDLRGNSNYCGILQKITDTTATEIWNYLSGNVQPISLGGTGATSPESARSGLEIGKMLASGLSLTPGNSVNVPGASKYNLFLMRPSGSGTPWLLWKNGNRITGNGSYSTASNMWLSAMSFTISDDVMTFESFSQIAFSMTNGAAGSITDTATVVSITGLI